MHGARVTPNLFQLLETHAEIGRVLGPVDGESTSTRVAVLGHVCWRERFNADPAMVSRTVRMDGEVYMVVGSSSRRTMRQRGDRRTSSVLGDCGRTPSGWCKSQSVMVAPRRFV